MKKMPKEKKVKKMNMIDETLMESFPASDPPSWTSGVKSHKKPKLDKKKIHK